MLRSSVHQSRVSVTMMYFGKTVHLSHNLNNMRDEVKVFQQHCGGENLCVYKGLIGEGGQCGDLATVQTNKAKSREGGCVENE